jgi:hypothetical protein
MPELTSEPDSKGGENKKKYIYKIKGPIWKGKKKR